MFDVRRVTMENLGKEMQEIIGSGDETRVIVNGDRNVKHDAVIDVMDALARFGVKSLGLGIELKR